VLYLTAQPESKDAYNDDAYAYYVKRETITVAPGAPVGRRGDAGRSAVGDPAGQQHHQGRRGRSHAHCDIAVGDQILAAQDAPYSMTCQGAQW
jgi:hypothetical protein